ncbi:hypothetical protein [Aliiglaciecola lipolytica]|uniref:SGNH hydrolase-type esterase domain-containing protein n=1 Tax=Aliiglaciecola lipolytica E3 TaxID=1127673 RepID=K6YFM1_9ALTE|nr:hypothetical protein [Aliiglaciecola lipolytica]GAC16947.1 hypothetical protein GLIP_4336 [Aliiglaciecola lipolytica E3]
MPNETPIERRRRIAAHSGITSLRTDFKYICKKHPTRIGIITEGDSWFAYPKKWVLLGADINVIHHIEKVVAKTDKVNMLRLACNGDEAVDMMSGQQKADLESVMQQTSEYVKLILFSGGGNDIVGKRDMPMILNQYEEGFTAQDCIHAARFNRKMDAIMLAYDQLIDLRDEYIPDATIITHTYDLAKPSEDGAEFFWGLIKTKPWIYPYLIEKNIPEQLHLPIVEILLGTLKTRLQALASQPEHLDKLVVVDTQGILRPGNKTDWLNEIHPTESGFKKIAKPIYTKMRELIPALPAFK